MQDEGTTKMKERRCSNRQEEQTEKITVPSEQMGYLQWLMWGKKSPK